MAIAAFFRFVCTHSVCEYILLVYSTTGKYLRFVRSVWICCFRLCISIVLLEI